MRVLDFSLAPDGQARAELAALPAGTAACLGAFDGMHLGHQGLIARARASAPAVAVVTFEPRPVDVLAPARASPRLQTPGQRVRVCRDLGVETFVILPFNREVSRMSPASFVEQFLIDGLRPAVIVVGYDFHFGAKRAGGPEQLRECLAPAGISVEVVDKIAAGGMLAGEKLGSTTIRELVTSGEVERAADLLGRLYTVAGEVEHGAARGRGLGYPTANVTSEQLHPAGGVYACFLTLLSDNGDELEWWPAVANLGTNPTFANESGTNESAVSPVMTLEVHALDVDLGDRLYGRTVEVAFVTRLRDERRFADVASLREAIAADIVAARPLLDDEAAARRRAWPPDPSAEPVIRRDRQAGGER